MSKCFHFATAMLILYILLSYIISRIVEYRENQNRTNRDAPVRMQMLRSNETREDMDE